MAQCTGCGRPTGIRGENDCPCWLSFNETAIIPPRLIAQTRRVEQLRKVKRK
jgi:hypothetical protein